MAFAWIKGHGTENDFVLLPDHDGSVHADLDPDFVAALCERRRGLGADGVIRIIRTADIGLPGDGEWFMDYRNADGSTSEMCGNGVRVFALHLVQEGLVDPAQTITVSTRGGDKLVKVEPDGELTVDMGTVELGGTSKVATTDHVWEAHEVHTGNPHAVAFVDTVAEAGPLTEAPEHDTTVYPQGVNVEFVERVAPQHVRMRVHERGSGETRSCGTGACAVGVATALADGVVRPSTYRVDVLGGTLHVTWTAEERILLTGPAQIVAHGQMEWTA